ncbi:Methyltransferase-like protein 25 [Nymphon striatum]|nr:Methyltransferase-like protein 25 [Nymphon striatum]
MSTLSDTINKLGKFLLKYRRLANVHTVDFIIDNQWETIVPEKIKEELEDIDLTNFVTETGNLYKNICTKDHPTLQALILSCEKYSLDKLGILTKVDSLFPNSQSKNLVKVDGFMSPKKEHEVQKLTNLICDIVDKENVELIVDVGSGKGYLSSNLSLNNPIKILGIDSCETNNHGAMERKRKLQKVLKKSKVSTGKQHDPVNACDVLNEHFTVVTERLHSNVKLETIIPEYDNNTVSLLTGLHACGNLTSTALKLFSGTNIQSLCVVGCCYHHIEEKFCESPFDNVNLEDYLNPGFPLSRPLINLEYAIGRNARMLACQSIDRIACGQITPSKKLFYRALLQVILCDKLGRQCVKLSNFQVGKIRKKCLDFQEYVRKSLTKLQLFDEIEISDDELTIYLSKYASMEDRICKFFYLRALLAPVIESLILLDRLQYLREQINVRESHVVKLFDPVVSPRCYALIANKV